MLVPAFEAYGGLAQITYLDVLVTVVAGAFGALLPRFVWAAGGGALHDGML